MLHPLHFLVDDGTCIQVLRHVVTGRPDQLHPALKGLAVGIGPRESRQEAMMDVDHATFVGSAQPPGNDLHEPRENDQFDRLLLQQFLDLSEPGLLVLSNFDEMKGNARLFRNRPAVFTVSNDGGDIHGDFPELRPPENLVEAVIGARHQHCGAHAIGKSSKVPAGLQRASQCPETTHKVVSLHIQSGGVDFQTGKEFLIRRIRKLVELHQVALVIGYVSRDPRH